MQQSSINIPPVVKNLLIINTLLFMAENFIPVRGVAAFFSDWLALHNVQSELFWPWQLVTYMFLHGSLSHLFFNMFALWMFGRILEPTLGSRRFLVFYFVCGIGAALIQMGVNTLELMNFESTYGIIPQALVNVPTVGASGAIFGILLGFGMLYPNVPIMFMFIPIPIKAKYFVMIYGAVELLWGVSGSMDNIAHFAHVGGMLWGFLLLRWWKHRGKIHY